MVVSVRGPDYDYGYLNGDHKVSSDGEIQLEWCDMIRGLLETVIALDQGKF